MAKTTLKPTNMYANVYEQAHSRLSKNKFFDENDWAKFAKGEGTLSLDMYADVLDKSESWSSEQVKKFYDEYNYLYADDNTRAAALYNEVYADKTNVDTKRTRFLRDEEGNVMYDAEGNAIEEEYQASDYDYFKSVIKERNNQLYDLWARQQEIERKESMNGFVKFLADIPSVAGEFVVSMAEAADDVIASFYGASEFINTALKGGRINEMADAFVEEVSSGEHRIFSNDQQRQDLIDFEKRYTHFRDTDGNFINIGRYAVGISNTLGRLVPSMLVGNYISGLASSSAASAIGANGLLTSNAIGLTASTANAIGTASSAMSQVIYYQGMHANNVKELYETFAAQGVTVPNSQILANATLKTIAEYGVEIGLSKLMGGSIFDNVVFGRNVGKSTSKTLAGSGIKRILKDTFQEGLEEVLQETSSFFVDYAWPKVWNENFGKNASLTWQALFDSFIIGAIVSFGGSSVKILSTKGKGFNNKTWLGRKFAAYEYGVNMQSFVQSYNEVLNYTGDTSSKEYVRAMTQMYASYRMVASIYGEMGEQRFKAANDILNTITKDIEDGKFDANKVKSLAQGVYNTVFGDKNMSSEIKAKLKEQLEKAEIDEILHKVAKGEEVDINDDALQKSVKEVIEGAGLKELNISKSGNNTINKEGVGIVPKNYIKSAGSKVVLTTFAENDIIENIASNDYYKFKLPLQDIVKTYKEIYNKNGSTEDAVRALLFDEDLLLYKSLLITANKDMMNLLNGILSVVNTVKIKKLQDTIYKNKLQTIFDNMTKALVEYLKVQPNADYNLSFLTKKQRRSIARVRWSNNIYSRVIKGEKLSKVDSEVLDSRISHMGVDEATKTTVRKDLYSSDADTRRRAMNVIDYEYNRTFTSLYDGKTYMPATSIPNIVFNNWLQRLGLTLETLFSMNALTETDIALISQTYGEINEDTVRKYRNEQFTKSTNNSYSIEEDVDNKFYVLDKNGERVGYSTYNLHMAQILQGDDVYLDGELMTKRINTSSTNRNDLVKGLVKKSLSAYTATMLTITDVINDDSLLDEKIYNKIKDKYGSVTPETTFVFLREYVLNDTGDTSITVMPDGSYSFVKVAEMQSALKKRNFKITEDCDIQELINDEYLTGMLKDTKIILTDEPIVAEYRPFKLESITGDKNKYRVYDNVIYVNRNIAKKGGAYLEFVILHEFQHAIQQENRFNLGLDCNWLFNCKSSIKNAIIADLRKHKPDLFLGEPSKQEIERRVSNYVYNSTAESMSMGLDGTPIVDFYPIIVKDTREGTEITFSWGTTYNLEEGSKMFTFKTKPTALVHENNSKLKKVTSYLGLQGFKQNPKSCFIMPDGQIRSFDSGEHYDVIKSIDNNVDTKYWDTIPQVVVEEDFVSVKITGTMNNATIKSLLDVMDVLFAKNIDFSVSEIYYADMDPYSYVAYSEDAENSEDLLQIYARGQQEASGKMSMKKLADNAYEIENLADLGINLDYDVIDVLPTEHAINEVTRKYANVHSAVEDYVMYNSGKMNLLNALNTADGQSYRMDMLKLLNKTILPSLSFEDFLNTDIPFYRIQETAYLHNAPFVSTYGAFSNTESLTALFEALLYGYDEDYHLIAGTYKPRDILLYIPTLEQECLMHPTKMSGNKIFDIKLNPKIGTIPVKDSRGYVHDRYILADVKSKNITSLSSANYTNSLLLDDDTGEVFGIPIPKVTGDTGVATNNYTVLHVNTNLDFGEEVEILDDDTGVVSTLVGEDAAKVRAYCKKLRALAYGTRVITLTTPDGRVITDEEVHSNLGEYIPVKSLAAPDVQKLKTADEVNTKSEAKKHKYVSKEVVNGKVKYTYEKGNDNRVYVGQKKYKGTPLEPFTKKYEVTQMSEELVNFIMSTEKQKVAPYLQNKIDKGTLKQSDVMHYFRDADLSKIDVNTFKAINDAFFHNEVIRTPEELQKYMDDTAKYYAARAVLRAEGNLDAIELDIPSLGEALIKNIEASPETSKVKKLYNKLYQHYYYNGPIDDVDLSKSVPIDVSNKYLKWLWMEHFDGSILQAGRIANIVRFAAIYNWNVTGEIKTKSLDSVISESKDGSTVTLGEAMRDPSALNDFKKLIYNADNNVNKTRLRNNLKDVTVKTLAKAYGINEETRKKAKKAFTLINEAFDQNQLDSLFVKNMLSEVFNVDLNEILEDEALENAINKTEHTSHSLANNIASNIRTIRKHLSPASTKLFLKRNSDIFDKDLKLRSEVYKTTNAKGRLVYKSVDELQPLWDRIRELKDAVKTGAYNSTKNLDNYLQNKKAILKMANKLRKDVTAKSPKVTKAKEIKVVTVEISDDVFEIETSKPMPEALQRMLDFEFSTPVNSRVQYLSNDSDVFLQNNFNTFLERNSEYLEALTQEDVDSIVDYFTHSEILKANISENKYRLYNAVQLYLSMLLLKGYRTGVTNISLTQEQKQALENKIKISVSSAAQLLADWKAVLSQLKPEEAIVKSLAKKTGIEFTTDEVKRLNDAVKTGDGKEIAEVKKDVYDSARKRYKGRKKSFFDKVLQFERMAMLSGPGTWIRNEISNTILYGIDVKGKHINGLLENSEAIGNRASKMLSKLLPKKFERDIQGQYKIAGTKVTTEVKDFLDVQFIKNGLLAEVVDGLNKTDVRSSKTKGRNTSDVITQMITEGIATKIFYGDKDNKIYEFVYKRLSDDKYVTKSMLKYLGKMLVEDNVDLSKGLTNEITKLAADAYVLASWDYMHKPNVWGKIDSAIQRTNPVLYFAWKQVFPFASSSWNWFVEGLNYTPLGLVNSIIRLGKLENTISEIEAKKQEGNRNLPDSRFTEYIAKRNLGKGVIGSITSLIGLLLVALGVVKLDEKDDTYKITVGDVSCDISGIFGTQSLFTTMSIAQGIIDAKNNDELDLVNIVAEAINIMFNDSVVSEVWTTLRYNNSLGDYVTALPISTANMMVPNFLKTITSICNTRKVQLSSGLLGKVEKIAVDSIPFLAYAFPHYVDVYTGEEQVMYKAQFWTNLANKLLPLKLYPYNMSDVEKEAINVGVSKSSLTGRYTINDNKVNLKASDIEKLNLYYGELNKSDLEDLVNDKVRIKVKNENGTYSYLKYSSMTEKQKSAAFDQIMDKNSTYAKIYVLTSKGYKYYASDSEYQTLKKLGITTNVYRKTNKLVGFVEP